MARTNREAPLYVTICLHLHSGEAAGQRFCRVSRAIRLPATLILDHPLPVAGRGSADVEFALPDGSRFESKAELSFDPEHPAAGSRIELRGLAPEELNSIRQYVDDRLA